MTPHLTLFTRPGCHLCDDAWALLEALAAEFAWELAKVDISGDEVLLPRLGNLIPVVDVEGGPLVYAPLTTETLLDAVAASAVAASRPA